MRRLAKTLSLSLLVLLGSSWIALADWTATGTFLYEDREFDQTGFTGTVTSLPVRFADLEVVDAAASGKKAVLAEGATDATGAFSIQVPDSKVRDVYVRVVSRSDQTGDLHIDVRQSSGGKVQLYAAAGPTVSGHDPQTNTNFGAATVQIGQGGEVFNTYDQMVRGADYVASLAGSRPGADKHLSTVWGINNGVSDSYFDTSSDQIVLRDTAGYDDTVVLHEMGHHIIRQYSDTTAVSGAHTFSMCKLDIQLAFEEGWASYFGNSALRFHGLPRSNIYTRTTGGPGPGNLVRYADLESDTQYLCEGSAGEVNVFSFLWDIADGPSTPDTTPGVDDSHDLLDLDDSEIWEVMTGALPGATTIALEDFWDGWFLPPVQNGFYAEMIDIADHLVIEYYEDVAEVNDTVAQAVPAPSDGTPIHNTFFRDPDLDGAGGGLADEDHFSFLATGGQDYVIETTDLLSGGDTGLRLIDSDGSSVLALNHDRSSSDESSRIDWTAPRSDQFFVRVAQDVGVGVYGSYDLLITEQIPYDNDGDGYFTPADCDDEDPNIHPGATEICDAIDQDCDGQPDNGFDVDGDGFTTCSGDCDDADPNVNPGMDEIPANGIDDNCNGEIDEEPPSDLVTILGATWKKGPGKLTVEATSDQQPGVTLTVVGFGTMIYDPAVLKYVYVSPRGTANPGMVTVESTGGGSDTAPVQ